MTIFTGITDYKKNNVIEMSQRNREHREIFRDWQVESERVQRYLERE